ncbi:MAG: hypoxanthine phosphoribosyltransferase [Lentimicrobiaceae bacterium]|nr:hypoxanthine phosphoribosyltransferase [Lentimicrobiaceae bacterium]
MQIQVKDKQFALFIKAEEIDMAISKVAENINHDYKGKIPLFLGILNGSFMFASDLLKKITVDCEISFVKIASYAGTQSTGKINNLIGLNEDIKGRHIIILEDIVDTGHTLASLLKYLESFKPASVKIATCLFKPAAFTKEYTVDYVGKNIPNDFIVGYGLDYDGFGRNLPDIYKIV